VTSTVPRTQMGSGWMTIHEASNLMGVSPATLRRWSDAGRIRTFTTPGGHRRFSRAAVDALLPDDAASPPDAQQATRSRIEADLPWFLELDPPTRRRTRQQVQQIAAALVSATVGRTAVERGFAFSQAEIATTRCAVLAATSGVGLRETVEGLLSLRARCLQVIADSGSSGAVHDGASAASVETLTGLLDRLLCHAMRAHEAAVDPS
jgi:excisionase family DNA binding protein